MNIKNTEPFFMSAVIAVLILGLFGLESSVAVSQAFATTDGANTDTDDSSNVEYSTVLSGDQEVPPVNTQAIGIADFSPSNDGASIDYTITVSNIIGATTGSIHFENGQYDPVVVTLFDYKFGTPQNEISQNGTIEAGDLTGPLKGMQVSDLIDAFNNGSTYVNIYTQQNPNGEIIGQITSEELQEDTEEQ